MRNLSWNKKLYNQRGNYKSNNNDFSIPLNIINQRRKDIERYKYETMKDKENINKMLNNIKIEIGEISKNIKETDNKVEYYIKKHYSSDKKNNKRQEQDFYGLNENYSSKNIINNNFRKGFNEEEKKTNKNQFFNYQPNIYRKYNLRPQKLTYEYDSTTLKGESYDKITLGTTPYGDYYIIAGSSNKDNLLQVVDQEGNIIKDFSKDIEKYKELNISRIYTTEKGIYVYLSFRSYESGYRGATATIEDDEVDSKILGESKVLATLDTRVPSDGIYNAMLYFTVNYKVDKKISGKGTITSTVEKAEEGEQVRFTVTPDKGHVLSYVKVTDSKGNVLTFTDNTFVMPASDVVIEAVFTPTNPNTGDIAIFAITIIALANAFIILAQKKKLSFLK
jgi:hypothetical protein